MNDLAPLENHPSELFGFASLIHYFRDRGAVPVLRAVSDCGLSVSPELVESALHGWGLELKSDIDGSYAEPLDYYFEDFSTMSKATRECLEAAIRLQPSGRVLDIGCGAGRFMKVFHDRGYKTTGIEISRLLVWLCNQRGVGSAQQLGAEQIDEILGSFEIQLLLGHNLGIGATPDGVKKLLGRCAQRAVDGGLLLVNSIDVKGSSESWARNRAAYNQRNPGAHVGETAFWLQYGPLTTPKFPWIHVSLDEIGRWSSDYGWHFAEVMEDTEEEGHWSGVLKFSA